MYCEVYNICRSKMYDNNYTKRWEEKQKYNAITLLYYIQSGILYESSL